MFDSRDSFNVKDAMVCRHNWNLLTEFNFIYIFMEINWIVLETLRLFLVFYFWPIISRP